MTQIQIMYSQFFRTMISIQQWRGRIGSYNRVEAHSFVCQPKDNPFKSSILFLSMMQSIVLAAVISILLIIGGIESNPGPPTSIQGES